MNTSSKILKDVTRNWIGNSSIFSDFNKGEFLKIIGEMSNDSFQDFCNEIKKLNHHHDTTVGLFATDKPEELQDDKKLLFEIEAVV